MKKFISTILILAMMISMITIVQAADLNDGGHLNVYAGKDAEGLSYEAAMAYKGVIDDMQEKYGDYQGYDGPWETMCTGFGLAMLIDFDNNGKKELLIGCGTINPDEDRLFYEVYGYENGLVKYTHQYCCGSMDLHFDLHFGDNGKNIYTITPAGSETVCDGSYFYGTLLNGKWEVTEYYFHEAGFCDGEWCGLEGKDVYRINGVDVSYEKWLDRACETEEEYGPESYDDVERDYYTFSKKGTERVIETLNAVISSKAQPQQSGNLSGILKDVYIKDSLGYDIQCLILDLESPQTFVISGIEGDSLEITGVEEIQLSIKNFDESMIGKKIKVVNYSDAFEGHSYYHILPVVILNAEVDILYEQTPVKVLLDGQNIGFDQEPVIVNDRTLVPMRAIFEALGAYVDWDGTARMVTATKGSNKISISIGSNQLNVNGTIKTLDVAAQIINDRTLVPVRAISEAFNCDVEWDGASRSVLITTKEIFSEIPSNNENTSSSIAETENKHLLNEELLDCLGKPKTEIEKMYGEITSSSYYLGGKYYIHGSLKTQMYYDNEEYNYEIDDDLVSYSVCTALYVHVTELFKDSSKDLYSMEELAEVFGKYEFIDDLDNDEMGPNCIYKFTYGDYTFSVEADHKNPSADYITVFSNKIGGTKSIGGIELHKDAADIIDLLGEPESKGGAHFEDATASVVQEWYYPSIGITLRMIQTEYDYYVDGILAESPCTFKTPAGIGIGSDVSELQRIYKEGIDPEENFIDYTTVVGTIYDGIFFHHDLENKKVVSIVIGAVAE